MSGKLGFVQVSKVLDTRHAGRGTASRGGGERRARRSRGLRLSWAFTVIVLVAATVAVGTLS